MTKWKYHPRPRDWTVKEKTLTTLLARDDFDLSNITVQNMTFSFTPVPTNPIAKRYNLSCNKEHEPEGILLLDILEGHRITITEDNAAFLSDFADQYEIKALQKRTKSLLASASNPFCVKTTFLRIRDFFIDFFTVFGTLGKILMTFWDFYGLIIVFNAILNFIVMITTMGIYTSTSRVAVFIFVLLPLTLYSCYFPNLTNIALTDFFSFPFFSAEKTIWPKIQRLIVLFIKVLPTKKPIISRTRLFGMGKWYDVMHGVIMFVVSLCLVIQALNFKAVMAVEVFLIIFCVGIPPIKYLILYICYLLHAVASWFQICRKKFVENGDFHDPFLCSMYFSTCPWTNLIYYKDICRAKESVKPTKNTKEDSHEEGSRSENPDGSVDVQDQSDTLTELGEDSEHETETYYFKTDTRLWYVILNAIFSKATAAVYVVIATVSFMIAERSGWSAGQVLGLIFGFMILGVPLSASISFPWILIRSIVFRNRSDEQVKRQFACIAKSKDRRKTFYRYMTYAKEWRFLRYATVILNGLLIIWIFCVIILALSYSDPTKNDQQSSSRTLNLQNQTQDPMFRMVAPAACSAKIKGLSILQLLILAQTGARESDEEMYEYAQEVMSVFFDDFDPNTSMKMYPAPFPDPLFKSNLRHTFLVDYGIHVFAIRGTGTFIDAVVDVELWASGVIYAVFFRFVPILGTFGRVSQEYNDALLALPKLVFTDFSLSFKYLKVMTDYIKSIPIGENEDAIIAGHSLGGGLAKLASLETGYQAVGVSGPGTHPIRYIFQNPDKTVRTNSFISINPEMDVVAKILGNEGTVFSIPCPRGSFQCHYIWWAVCQTSAMCNGFSQHYGYCRTRFSDEELQEMLDAAAPHAI